MNYLWSATDLALRALESLIASRIHVSGLERLGGGPTLFVANHFTRFETFLVPYVHHKHTGRVVRCLADKNLFHGPLGAYLRQMHAWPTDDPGYKQQIVQDLATGACDWVIYPEGAMVKTKEVAQGGRLFLKTPFHTGNPRTGAAVFALKAEALRWLGKQALADADLATQQELAQLLGTDTLARLAEQSVRLHPVTITYYPLRPGVNLADRAARYFAKRLPPSLDEELKVEGNLLLGGADIDIHYGQPLELDQVVHESWRVQRVLTPASGPTQLLDAVLAAEREPLILDAMQRVYARTAINLDHLVAGTLRQMPVACVRLDHFLRTCLLVAARAVRVHRFRHHPRLLPDLLHELTRGGNPAVTEVLALADHTGVAKRQGDQLCIDRAAFDHPHEFHSLRLHNPLAVIANELEPSVNTVRMIGEAIAMPAQDLDQALADELAAYDAHLLAREVELSGGGVRLMAKERLLGPRDAATGIILSHGYLACPEEVEALGAHLAGLGHRLLLPRLPGHGTAPERLGGVLWQDWQDAYLRAVLRLRLERPDRRIVAAGFSAGGLLALRAAALRTDITGVVTLNTPLRLRDRRAHLAPLVKAWNRGMGWMGATRKLHWISNQQTESPDLNYVRHPPHGLLELLRLMDRTRELLPRISCPVAVLQGDADPVIDPVSAQLIYDRLGASRRPLRYLPATRHGVVRGEGSAAVHAAVAEAVSGLLG